MKKLYINEEDLNEEEKRTGCVSYERVVQRIIGNEMVLCNNIAEIDPYIWDTIDKLDDDDDDDDDDDEIFQYYLCNISNYGVELNKELGYPLKLAYSEKLEVDVLLVDHYGTAWDYVMTDVEWTTNM